MKTKMVYFGEMQKPDVLTEDADGNLADVTVFTDEVVDMTAGEETRILLVWNYALYDVPITDVAWAPSCMRRDVSLPMPSISPWEKVVETQSGKWVGLAFTANVGVVDAWVCNVQTLHKYFNEEMGREYTHRRSQYFTISTQPPADEVLQAIQDAWEDSDAS